MRKFWIDWWLVRLLLCILGLLIGLAILFLDGHYNTSILLIAMFLVLLSVLALSLHR